MIVYVTKHALTKGIEELIVEECPGIPGLVQTISISVSEYKRYFRGEGNEWHRQLWQAQAHANHMRNKKIESLKKKISKLEKMTF